MEGFPGLRQLWRSLGGDGMTVTEGRHHGRRPWSPAALEVSRWQWRSAQKVTQAQVPLACLHFGTHFFYMAASSLPWLRSLPRLGVLQWSCCSSWPRHPLLQLLCCPSWSLCSSSQLRGFEVAMAQATSASATTRWLSSSHWQRFCSGGARRIWHLLRAQKGARRNWHLLRAQNGARRNWHLLRAQKGIHYFTVVVFVAVICLGCHHGSRLFI